jgi:DMSO/TMAO reductase YedYZ molybdopterin-dependent catalytic subunit
VVRTARVNLALLGLLGTAFLTGWVAFSYASAPARWSLVVHASTGAAILLLLPWKSVIARRGLKRRRPGRWASMALAALVLASILGGLLHSSGLLPYWGAYTAMELHVGAAIAAVPFAAWHVLARPVRLRPRDLSRRSLLRGAAGIALATATYAGGELAERAARLPGAQRRFTGSYEMGSFEPSAMPVSSWMCDPVPALDRDRWRLEVAGRGLTYAELASFDDRVRAMLDCTGGFCSEQDWAGVRLDRLLGAGLAGAGSIRVASATGYDRRFPAADASRLLLALRMGGSELSAEHGFPARLVAPDRRGFWWVKWVVGIAPDPLPYWWQPPFPLQ